MIEAYLRELESVRKLSPHTLTAYRGDLASFAAYCAERGVEVEAADRQTVRAYFAALSRRGLESSSINRMRSSLRGYFHYLLRMKRRTSDPMIGLRALKDPQTLPSFLSPEEVSRFLDAPGDDFAGVRDRLILELLYSTGCRVAELAAMNLGDLSLGEGSARVRGKGGRDRIVFLGPAAVEAVATWRPIRENRLDRDDADAARALVLNAHGRRITERGIFFIIARYARQVTPAKSVGPHAFRHSFATHLVNDGADLRAVQELLGHATLHTTQIYTHTGIERLAAVYERAHPHARSAQRASPEEKAHAQQLRNPAIVPARKGSGEAFRAGDKENL